MVKMFEKLKRYSFDLALFSLGIVLLLSGAYAEAENPAQLLLFKAVSVSAAIIHAHFAGKLLFPVVDWEATTLAGKHYARISLYFVVTIAYTFGG